VFENYYRHGIQFDVHNKFKSRTCHVR